MMLFFIWKAVRLSMAALAVFLHACNNSVDSILFIILVWGLILLDYLVKGYLAMFDVVHQAVAENKYLLLRHGVSVEVQDCNFIGKQKENKR